MMTFGYDDGRQDPTFDKQLLRLQMLVADLQKVRNGEPYQSFLNKDSPMLRDWRLACRPAPCLIGIPTGHPKLGNGQEIVTSDVWLMSADRTCARTLSRWYHLCPSNGRSRSQP